MQNERLPQHTWHRPDFAQLATIVLVALALVPTGAHLAELPNKLRLPATDYLTVQGIYQGWAIFGIVVLGALLSTGLHTYLVRRNHVAFVWSAIAFCCVVATQLVFWMFTYPVNVLTQNWSVAPLDLEAARQQWEFAHAVSGVLNLAALFAIVLSVLASRPYIRSEILSAIESDVGARLSRARSDPVNGHLSAR